MSSASVTRRAQLHGEVVDALLDAELVDRDDVGVRQLDRGLRFVHEALDEGVVGGELGADLLDHELLLEAAGSAQRRQKTRAMPPIAMGRSRTYLPKICGNRRRRAPRPQVYTFADAIGV